MGPALRGTSPARSGRFGSSRLLRTNFRRKKRNFAGARRSEPSTQRFFPNEPVNCPECGVLQDRAHVLLKCPKYRRWWNCRGEFEFLQQLNAYRDFNSFLTANPLLVELGVHPPYVAPLFLLYVIAVIPLITCLHQTRLLDHPPETGLRCAFWIFTKTDSLPLLPSTACKLTTPACM